MFHDDKELYEFSDFRLDIAERLLLRKDKRVPLSEKAFEILCVLVRQSGHLVGKDELLTKVWADTIVEENNLDKNISFLRQALGRRKDKEKFIETVRGRGYRFIAAVRRVKPENAVKDLNRVINYEQEKAETKQANPPSAIRRLPSRNIVALADWRHEIEEDEKSSQKISTAARVKEFSVAESKKNLSENSSAEDSTHKIKNRQLGFAVGLIFLLLVSIGLGYRFFANRTSNADAIKSIAVLPFENASGDANLDYLSDGISESVIDRLSELPQLKVIARSSSFKYRGANAELQEAARKLGAQALITGRVARRGDDLSIRVELIDTRENAQLWGEQFDRKAADALVVQEEIAQTIAGKLRLKLSGAEERKLAKKPADNAEAYELYLRGRFLQNKMTPQDLFKSIEYYQQAVALDPNFALAYVGLAESTGRLNAFRDIPQRNYKQMAREYALKAVSLDDQLPEAHATLGSILSLYDYDFAGVEREYQLALELNPSYAEAHLWRGQLLSSFGRHEEALAEIRRAMELDPMSLEASSAYGEALFFARRYDESIAHLKKVVNLDANYFPANRVLGFNYEMKGDYAARIAQTDKLNRIAGNPERGEAIKKSFERSGWQGFLRDACDNKFDIHEYLVATWCAELGDKDKAFAFLEKLYEERSDDLILIRVDPRLDNLREDQRFMDLMRRMNFE